MASRNVVFAVLLVLLTGCTSSNNVSMDGLWRLEGTAASQAGECTVLGDIHITGQTGERWLGAGRRTLTGRLSGIEVARNDSIQFSTNGSWHPGYTGGNFRPDEYVITRPVEPSLLAGVWWCVVQGPSGTAEAQGHWVMRRVSSEPVIGIF